MPQLSQKIVFVRVLRINLSLRARALSPFFPFGRASTSVHDRISIHLAMSRGNQWIVSHRNVNEMFPHNFPFFFNHSKVSRPDYALAKATTESRWKHNFRRFFLIIYVCRGENACVCLCVCASMCLRNNTKTSQKMPNCRKIIFRNVEETKNFRSGFYSLSLVLLAVVFMCCARCFHRFARKRFASLVLKANASFGRSTFTHINMFAQHTYYVIDEKIETCASGVHVSVCIGLMWSGEQNELKAFGLNNEAKHFPFSQMTEVGNGFGGQPKQKKTKPFWAKFIGKDYKWAHTQDTEKEAKTKLLGE